LIAETTLTKEQHALLEWCRKHRIFVEFTTCTSAKTYMRMIGKYHIGELEYILHGNTWYPHTDRVDKIECSAASNGKHG